MHTWGAKTRQKQMCDTNKPKMIFWCSEKRKIQKQSQSLMSVSESMIDCSTAGNLLPNQIHHITMNRKTFDWLSIKTINHFKKCFSNHPDRGSYKLIRCCHSRKVGCVHLLIFLKGKKKTETLICTFVCLVSNVQSG